MHACTEGFTSLAVLVGAGGVALGWRLAASIVGLLIAILGVLRGAAREVLGRLMDSIDPNVIDLAEHTLLTTDGVRGVADLRMRWVGHSRRRDRVRVVG